MSNKQLDVDFHIQEIIKRAFNILKYAHDSNQEGLKKYDANRSNRIMFPLKGEKNRTSEQELRFVFVEAFNAYCAVGPNWFYGVEVPTIDNYSFSGKGERRAQIDLVVFDEEGNRIALVEFKANNRGPKEHEKDMKKLTNPKEGVSATRYFIEVVESANGKTIKSIKEKTVDNPNPADYENPSAVKVILCVLSDNSPSNLIYL